MWQIVGAPVHGVKRPDRLGIYIVYSKITFHFVVTVTVTLLFQYKLGCKKSL